MRPAFRLAMLAAPALGMLSAGGCNKTITSDQFLARYTTNIDVPNPGKTRLPTRTYAGVRGMRTQCHYLRDSIPPGQGGGFFGKVVDWRCPVAELPAGFPEGVVPGDVVFDGRKGSAFTYMIQSATPDARPATRPAAATQPAGS